jgi:carboxylesterase type B
VVAGIITDKLFTDPARFLVARHAKSRQPVYRYFLAMFRRMSGAELRGGTFRRAEVRVRQLWPRRDSHDRLYFPGKSIAAVAQRYWTTFAKTGNPNGPIVLSRPLDKIDRVLVLDSSGQHSAGRFPQTTARLCSSEIPRLIGMRENRNRWTAEGVDV